MKKILVLFMLLLTVCSTAFAESLGDVLKDCKLDRSRWIVMEWFKTEKFVRFYDSESLKVTAPGQFELETYDYYYENICKEESCNYRNMKHYHSEKSIYDSYRSTKKLLSFGKLDANLNVLSSYDYPASVQVADPINKKSIDNKTMLKIKDSLKNDKDFTKEVKPELQKTQALPKITGLVPLPMDIGATDGEWTYLGRFMAPENFSSPLEWQTRMTQYTGSAEANNLYDVYFYHSHYGNSDGQGCPKGNIGAYKCVLKFVPLDRNGRPVNKSGEYYGTHLLSMTGATKGVFAACVLRLRTFDSVTHQQLVDVTNESVSGSSALNGKDYSDSSYNLMKVRHNAPYYKAMQITGCHTAWQTRVTY